VSIRYPEVIRLDIPATNKYLNILSACIAELLSRIDGLSQRETITYNIQLAAHETCANIVDHAYTDEKDKRITITLTLADQPFRLIIDLYDTGRAFDLESTPAPNLSEPRTHGYGLFLVHSLMDEVVYHPETGNNHWCLTKHL